MLIAGTGLATCQGRAWCPNEVNAMKIRVLYEIELQRCDGLERCVVMCGLSVNPSEGWRIVTEVASPAGVTQESVAVPPIRTTSVHEMWSSEVARMMAQGFALREIEVAA